MVDTYVGAADSKQGAFLSQAQSKAWLHACCQLCRL